MRWRSSSVHESVASDVLQANESARKERGGAGDYVSIQS
jgi:hypothetical protein